MQPRRPFVKVPLRGFSFLAGFSGEVQNMSEPKAQYTCMDYRQEMVLLGMKRRLEQETLDEAERKAIQEQVRALEAAMDMD